MKAFQLIELTLTEKEEADYVRYAHLWGEDCVDKAKDRRRSGIWIATNLDHTAVERKRPYNCYNTGIDTYVRKDGQTLTQDDIDAIQIIDSGQMNVFKISDDGMMITHRWECDSGD